ncbi:MAG: hypothetical protein IT359_17490 [Gemmatimonadaceae bacterium]|nr:hypothetical protein [Gemmatimonadaceae bacterium]
MAWFRRSIVRPSAAPALALALALVAARCTVTSAAAPVRPFTLSAADAALLDTVQRRTFDFFWERSDTRTGLTPDRWPTPSFASIAAVGFALTAYPVGVERGWITRAEAAQRTLVTLQWFWRAPQGTDARGMTGHRGFFYHFLDMQDGARFATVELSTIDTALLLGGVLFCQSYYDRDVPLEASIRAYADSLYRRVEWTWIQPRAPLVNHRWRPEDGFSESDWTGYDESMLLYVLALGSPTYPIDAAAWAAYTRTYRWATFHGQSHINFEPLFGHQYSHLWIDFRGIQDAYMRARGIDYFENSRRAVLSQRAYAIANPSRFRDYGANVWGLTASDGPLDSTLIIDGQRIEFHTYWARGAAATAVRDDGTLAPTAAAGSFPFAPEVVMPAIRAMRERYGDSLFQRYGFLDAFNPSLQLSVPLRHGRIVPGVGWIDGDYLGIDQGPIVAMIENYRSELVWRTMRRNAYIVRGLRRSGFTGGWLAQASLP